MLTLRKAVRDALEKDIEVLQEQKDMLIHEIEKLRKTFKDNEKGKITMKKSDLKTGMVVECRNGKKYMYLDVDELDGAFVNQTGFELWFSENLTNACNECSNIVKIYKANAVYQLSQKCWDEMPLIWERKEPREMTLAEIEKELGYPVEIVEMEESE